MPESPNGSASLQRTKRLLDSRGPGPISDTEELDGLLASCWLEFSGHDCGGMEPDKLYGRMENVKWDPPILTFTIERHGGLVKGSSRAELQFWRLDLIELTAECWNSGYRQIGSRQPPLDVGPIAEEVAELIFSGEIDERLEWLTDGSVRVKIAQLIPYERSIDVGATVTGRRKRLRSALESLLQAKGWTIGRVYWRYLPPDS